MTNQTQKAEDFRNQHHQENLLLLPNIWDPLGARLLQKLGYPSVATASVATALSQGYRDDEQIPFETLMELVGKITRAVDIPVTVDMEKGYANNLTDLKENIRHLINQGAIGLNIEDSLPARKGFYPVVEQCRKIEAVREIAIQNNVPLVINARTDGFVLKTDSDPLAKSLERARAYQSAGADCIYPILISSYNDIARFISGIELPVNVNLLKPISDLRKLKELGVARVSVGPQLINHVLTTLKQIGEELLQYDTTTFFGRDLLSREYLDKLV